MVSAELAVTALPDPTTDVPLLDNDDVVTAAAETADIELLEEEDEEVMSRC